MVQCVPWVVFVVVLSLVFLVLPFVLWPFFWPFVVWLVLSVVVALAA